MSAAAEPIEIWRGSVSTWECDEMGHLNIRFHVARAIEGLAELAARAGLPDVFAAASPTRLVVRDQHIRFLHEARAGQPFHMVGGCIDADAAAPRFLQSLIHSDSGMAYAHFLTRVALAGTDGGSVAWPRADSAPLLAIPGDAAPRGLAGPASAAAGKPARAARVTGRGVIGAIDCDTAGFMRPEIFIGRVNIGIPHLVRGIRDVMERELGLSGRIGGAALEYRLVHHRWPRAGARVELRSGFVAIEEKRMHMVHWLLDPDSGETLASAENVSVNLDLVERRSIALPMALREKLQSYLLGAADV